MSEAVLKSVDGLIEVRIVLFASKETNWINYTLKVSDVGQEADDNNYIENLSLLDQEVNFLQVFPENEVEMLVEGIKSVTSVNGQSFIFSPIDEKDFIFEIACFGEEHYKIVSLFVTNEAGSIYRGIRFKVNVDVLTAFGNQLVQPE